MGSSLDGIFRFLRVFLFLAMELTNNVALVLLLLSLLLLLGCTDAVGKKLLNFAVNGGIHLLSLALLGSCAVINTYPLGTEISYERVIVVIVNDWIHDLVNRLYFSKYCRTVRLC